MKGSATRKVPGGKLVKAQVEYGYILEHVKITGDFFLHPEEAINDIENAVLSCHHSDSEKIFKKKIQEVVERKSSLRRHQDSLTYPGVDDELLFGVAQVERFLEYLGGGLVLLEHNLSRAAFDYYSSRAVYSSSSHEVRHQLCRDDKCGVVVPPRPRYLRDVLHR